MPPKAPFTSFRSFGRKSIAELVEQAVKPISRKRGFAERQLLLEWPNIVGSALACHALPQKIAHDKREGHGAVLHIACHPSYIVELTYLEPLIIDKIAAYFGYKVITRLVVHHGLPEASHNPIKSNQKPDKTNDLQKALAQLAKTIKEKS